MKIINYVLGELCKVILPIPEEIFYGNKNSSIAVCTLSSINLLKEISNSELLDKVAIVGRLLSENKGIDSLIRYVNSNTNIKTIILCGKEVWGHKAGDTLLKLYENGINSNGRIINSSSPDPFLEVSSDEVNNFQNQITLIDKIGETKLSNIKELIDSIKF
ncbi:MAG: tetrahydromethanopterin S-methyltransferase subunit A [Nitrosopumilaceae archaeon]